METKNAVIKSEQTPQALIALAIEKGMSVEQLGKLFDLQERWEKKEAEKAFLEAFANFQLNCPKIVKKKAVNYPTQGGANVNYKYATLDEISEQIKKPLHSVGLSYRFEFSEKEKQIICSCIVSHVAGHSKLTTMDAPRDDSGKKNLIQQIGSTHSYLQRYSLIGALGLTTADADVDGQQPSAKGPNIEDLKKSEEALAQSCLLIDDFTDAKELQAKYLNILADCIKSGLLKKDEKKLVDYINSKNHKLIADAKKAGVSSK